MKKNTCFRHPGCQTFILGAALWGALLLTGCRDPEEPSEAPPPVEVATVTVAPRTLPAVYPFVARIRSSHQVVVVARVGGVLEKIAYREGGPVEEGKVLFRIDPRPFQAAVDAARAVVEIRESQLWTATARYNRVKPLADRNATSKSDLDDAVAAVKSATAALEQAKAHLAGARLDLGYATITSPVKGVAGQAKVRQGSFVAAGTELTYVARLDPAWVDFSISQNAQAAALEEVESGRLVPPRDNHYTIALETSGGRRYPHTGLVNFSDPSFSQETGTFLVRAEIPNPDGDLRPGMFVKAYLTGAVRPDCLAVPQKAVQQTADGHVVYIASPRGLAEVRPVTVGDWVGRDWIITQGLAAGEAVIVDGFMGLAPGMPVKRTAADRETPARPAAGA